VQERPGPVRYPFDLIFAVDLAGPGEGPLRITRGFAVPPGEYDVYVALRERASDPPTSDSRLKAAVLKQPLSVPDLLDVAVRIHPDVAIRPLRFDESRPLVVTKCLLVHPHQPRGDGDDINRLFVFSDAVIAEGGMAAFDHTLRAAIRSWRYRPLVVNGAPTPFCHFMKIKYALN